MGVLQRGAAGEKRERDRLLIVYSGENAAVGKKQRKEQNGGALSSVAIAKGRRSHKKGRRA